MQGLPISLPACRTSSVRTGTSNWGYWSLYFLMVVVFTFFYTSVLFDQQNYGDNLKKVGATVPGVHTGAPTQKYLSTVQRRITLPGAVFLGLVAIMPFLLGLLLKALGLAAASSADGYLPRFILWFAHCGRRGS